MRFQMKLTREGRERLAQHRAETAKLADMVIELRAGNDLSQKDFAAAIGITPQYLCDIENGRRLGSVDFVAFRI